MGSITWNKLVHACISINPFRLLYINCKFEQPAVAKNNLLFPTYINSDIMLFNAKSYLSRIPNLNVQNIHEFIHIQRKQLTLKE